MSNKEDILQLKFELTTLERRIQNLESNSKTNTQSEIRGKKVNMVWIDDICKSIDKALTLQETKLEQPTGYFFNFSRKERSNFGSFDLGNTFGLLNCIFWQSSNNEVNLIQDLSSWHLHNILAFVGIGHSSPQSVSFHQFVKAKSYKHFHAIVDAKRFDHFDIYTEESIRRGMPWFNLNLLKSRNSIIRTSVACQVTNYLDALPIERLVMHDPRVRNLVRMNAIKA